jgi:hypothetical protein
MRKAQSNPKTDVSPLILPTLDEAISRWRGARRRFLSKSGAETLQEFHQATDLLFVTLLGDDAERPWAAAAFRGLRESLTSQQRSTGSDDESEEDKWADDAPSDVRTRSVAVD